MVKKLRKWAKRKITLTIGPDKYEGYVRFTSLHVDGSFPSQWKYDYFFKTSYGAKIPIYGQGKNRVIAVDGGLVQKL